MKLQTDHSINKSEQVTDFENQLLAPLTSAEEILIQSQLSNLDASHLTSEFLPTIQPVSKVMWQKLFAGHPDKPEVISHMQAIGLEGFKLGSILIKDAGIPVLLLPLFITNYDLALTLDGKVAEYAQKLKNFLPAIIMPKVLVVGFAEGEWGQAGINFAYRKESLKKAWKLALKEIGKLAQKEKVQIVGFRDFTEETGQYLPVDLLNNFNKIKSQPYCYLDIDFDSLDQYIDRQESDLKRYLKRVQKNASTLSITRTRNIEGYLEQIYSLYHHQAVKSGLTWGIQPIDYFAHICQNVPQAQFVLYECDNKLIGFELLFEYKDCLVQKYIGIDPDLGIKYKLYFLSWLENISYCLKKNIPSTHCGSASEGLKVKLGCKLHPSYVLMRHLNPLFNYIFSKVRDDLAYESEVDTNDFAYGNWWTKA